MSKHYFTSESVTEGHPDKICDKVSDAILDAILAQDKNARVACETTCTTGIVSVMGEITTTAVIDFPAVIRKAVCDTGFNNANAGFDGNSCAVITTIDKQSPDIDMGVSRSMELKGGEEDILPLCIRRHQVLSPCLCCFLYYQILKASIHILCLRQSDQNGYHLFWGSMQ